MTKEEYIEKKTEILNRKIEIQFKLFMTNSELIELNDKYLNSKIGSVISKEEILWFSNNLGKG